MLRCQLTVSSVVLSGACSDMAIMYSSGRWIANTSRRIGYICGRGICMFHDDLHAYAELAVSSLSLQPGQNLLIRAEPVHWPLVNHMVAIAYEQGARYVAVEAEHAAMFKARVETSRPEYLTHQPAYLRALYAEMIEENWAVVSVKNPDDPDFLAGIDAARSMAVRKPLLELQYAWRARLRADAFPWLVLAAPTPGWGAKVLKMDAGPEALEELWRRMKPILRLDQSDPHQAWRDNGARLQDRARLLDSMRIRELHFTAPGTDLTVRLDERAHWKGGHAHTPDGRVFFPNLPTEEVFTTPNRHTTTGTVRVTRPVIVTNQVVEGASFRFEEGKVVAFDADSGKASLASFLDSDEGSRFLGEIALVDVASPVFLSNTVFYNILFDENAACHFALGSAYPGCISGYDGLTADQRAEIGINESAEHTDFMIGSEELTVTARCHGSDTAVVIIENGEFRLDEEPGEKLHSTR
ncbi:MAG: aminopeptidase [Spirochaetaceae bacterium]|nr:MAG: aminopeptidase [Spirochaetaceae bacterium]